MTIADLNLPTAKLSQFATAMGDTSGTWDATGNPTGNQKLQNLCSEANNDVARLTMGYVLDPTSLTQFGRALTLFRAYAYVGPAPRDVETAYKEAMAEMTAIAEGKRPNLPKVATTQQSSISGQMTSQPIVHGRMNPYEVPR